jgi:acyl-CoA synthetase (AMP-forming)/AMP-acid ligase II
MTILFLASFIGGLLLAVRVMIVGVERPREEAGVAIGDEPDEPDEDDPVVLMYTGGTTGLPKGVLLDHRAEMLNLYHVLATWREVRDVFAQFIGRLGLPGHLSEVGVTREKFELIGRNAMLSVFTRANPRTIKGPEDIVEILQLAA